MRIMAVCGSGLGSSFMLEMNIKKVLTGLGVEAEVGHSDLSSLTQDMAELFIMAKDISASCPELKNKITLESIINKVELKEKLEKRIKEMGI